VFCEKIDKERTKWKNSGSTIKRIKKVKLSTYQAVEAYRVVRR
jgi:hypothetical protein